MIVVASFEGLGQWDAFADAVEKLDLSGPISALLEAQTRERLQAGGPAPDGERWRPWSDSYARTRHANHGLLRDRGRLQGSVEAFTEGDDPGVRATMIYAARHQFGYDGPAGFTPARPYIGLSRDNEDEILEMVDDLLGGAWRQ